MLRQSRVPLSAGVLLLMLAAGVANACDSVPPAVVDITANRYYTDANNSVIDPVLRAQNIAAVKPVEDFLSAVARAASAYQASPDKAAQEAQCGLVWLASWANSKAMLGKMSSNQAYYTRKWTLGGLSLSYAKLKPAASEAQRRDIEAWLKVLAGLTIEHSDNHKGVRNNHYYWEGLAVTATGAVTGDARALAWGRKVFDEAMSHIASDGSLPLEMARATKALHYHLFAVEPLVMMASILDLRSPKLELLLQFTLASAADPSAMQKATGFVQEPARGPFNWKVIHARHLGGPSATAAPTSWQPRLGGDLQIANPLEHLAPRS
jgi:poly(beta-D-mannuronate) lyase